MGRISQGRNGVRKVENHWSRPMVALFASNIFHVQRQKLWGALGAPAPQTQIWKNLSEILKFRVDASNFIAEIVKYFQTALGSNISINFLVNVHNEHTFDPIFKQMAFTYVLEGMCLKHSVDKPPDPPFGSLRASPVRKLLKIS